MKRDCLRQEDIRVLLEGELPSARLDAVSDHLERCEGCHRSVESSAGNVGSWRAFEIEAAAPSPGPSPVLRGLMDRLVQAPDWPQLDSPEQIVAGMRRLLEPSDSPDSLGRFGAFEIHGVVDAGGMGVVWRAWDSTLNRMVALKVLSPVLATSGAARQRFLREARAAAAIRHENVVPIFSAAEIHGLPCLAMELVPGESLARRLERQGRLSPADVVRIGLQVADGLAAAHAQAIVHRDVKPANLLIEHGTGRVRITDFGLARVADECGLTRSGCIAGTPEYLSPEQAGGRPVDHRADLFSLGCVLYALGTGQSPFHADSLVAAIRNVCDLDPPSMRKHAPSVPRELSDLVARLLEKDPARRIQTAVEVRNRLFRLLERGLGPAAMRGDHHPRTAGFPAGASPTGNSAVQFRDGRRGSDRAATSFLRRAIGGVRALLIRALRRPWVRVGCAVIAALGLGWAALTARRVRPSTAEVSVLPEAPSAAAAAAVGPMPDAFRLGNGRDRERGAFATLPEAVAAAVEGDVIECRWNGDWITEGMDLGEKPLTLRAARGFLPAIVIARRPGPLLRTRARVELEGLTFKVPMMESTPSTAAYHSVFGEAIIEVVGAPLFMANCRLEMRMPPGGGVGPVCVIGLKGPGTAVFENCEFYSPFIGTIFYLPFAADAPGGDRLVVRNCVQTGFALVHVKQTAAAPPLIELTGNTTAVGFVVGFNDPPAGDPVAILANRNIFDVERVVNTAPQSRRNAPETLLRWSDGTNVVQVRQEYTRTRPAITGRADWRRFAGLDERPALEAELNLSYRIIERRRDLARLTPEDFLLTGPERDALKAALPGGVDTLGVNPRTCGPGRAYDALSAAPAWSRR